MLQADYEYLAGRFDSGLDFALRTVALEVVDICLLFMFQTIPVRVSMTALVAKMSALKFDELNFGCSFGCLTVEAAVVEASY